MPWDEIFWMLGLLVAVTIFGQLWFRFVEFLLERTKRFLIPNTGSRQSGTPCLTKRRMAMDINEIMNRAKAAQAQALESLHKAEEKSEALAASLSPEPDASPQNNAALEAEQPAANARRPGGNSGAGV